MFVEWKSSVYTDTCTPVVGTVMEKVWPPTECWTQSQYDTKQHSYLLEKTVCLSPHSTTPTSTPINWIRPTRQHPYVRHARFPREDLREDVGVGVVECGLINNALISKSLVFTELQICTHVRSTVSFYVHPIVCLTAFLTLTLTLKMTHDGIVSNRHCTRSTLQCTCTCSLGLIL